MKKQSRKAPDFAASYREAGQILGAGGRRLLLIEAILLLLLSVWLYVFVTGTYLTLLGYWMYGTELWLSIALEALLVAVIALLTLFFTLPLLIGFLGLAARMEQGREVVLADLFAPFSSVRAYGRALGLAWGALWRLGSIVLCVILTCRVGIAFFAGSLLAGVICGGAVALEIFVGLWLCQRRFSTLFVTASLGLPPKDARAYAKDIWRTCRRGGAVFVLHMLWRILLGFLTLGVLLLWDTLPRLSVAYFRYCRYMNETNIRSEEYK